MRKISILTPALSIGVVLAPAVMATPAGAFPVMSTGLSGGSGLKVEQVGYRNRGFGRSAWRGHRGRWGLRRHSSWRAGVSAAPAEIPIVQKDEPATPRAADAPVDDEATIDRGFMARFAEEPRSDGLMAIVGPALRRIGRLIVPQEDNEAQAAMTRTSGDDGVVIGRLSAQWVKKISPIDVAAASVVLADPQIKVRDVVGGWQASAAGISDR